MNLDQHQTSGRTDKSRIDFRQFCAFGGIIAPRGSQVMPGYHRPIANIHTGNSICIPSASTDEASERQALPITGIHITALRAAPAGIPRGNQLKVNSLGCGFVLHKELSHSIRPAVDPVTHVLSFGNTGFTDISQIFHCYSLCSLLFSPIYKLLGRTMQHVLGYGCFVPRHALEQSAGRTRANRLYFGHFSTNTSTTMIQLATTNRKRLTIDGIGGGKNSLDTGINSDNAARCFRFWDLNMIGKNQIPSAVALLQLGISPLLSWRDSLISQGNWIAPEANTLSGGVRKVTLPNYGKNLVFKLNLMPLLLGSLRLVNSRQSAKYRAGQLRRKLELAADVAVVFLVKTGNASLFRYENPWRKMVDGCKKHLAKLVELLRFPNLDLDGSCCFHYNILFLKDIEISLFVLNYFTERSSALTPSLKA